MLKQLLNTFIPQKKGALNTFHKSRFYGNKQSEGKPLQFSEPHYRMLLESMEEGFAYCQMIYDKVGKPVDFRYLYVNPSFATQTGIPVKKFLGRTVKEVLPEIEHDWIDIYEEVLRTGKSKHFENDAASIQRTFDVYAWRVEKKCFAVVVEDITERKKIEEKLSLQAAALESASNGIVITDTKGVIEWVNTGFAKLTGYTSEEAVGKSTSILKSGKQNKQFYQNLWNTILAGKVWHGEIIDRKKDGSLYTEEQSITPVKDKSGKILHFIAIKHDVTERKKLEEKLLSQNLDLKRTTKAQEKTKKAMFNVMEDLEEIKKTLNIERLKDEAMLASIGDGVVGVDKDGKVIIVNQAGCKLLGFKESELLGKKFVEVISMTDEKGELVPNDKRPFQMIIAGTTTTTTTDPAYYFIRKDKTKFPVAVTVSAIINSGKTIGAIEVFRDISYELEIDRAKTEFVSLASHQLRTPLGITKWYLEVLRSDDYFKTAPQKTQEYFDELCKNNERVLVLVSNLLSISRIDQGKVKNAPESVNIIEIITNAVKELENLAKSKKVTLHLEIQVKKLPNIFIDSLRFNEVIENLLVNAIEYTQPPGKVTVTVCKSDGKIAIRVKDTGIGISATDQRNLFTKFFRSEEAIKNNPKGSGLGLYVVKSYVEGWGGKISVESVEGKGSTFTISLPIKKGGVKVTI